MLRKLLFLIFTFSASTVMAQVGITPIKTTGKPADPQIDYKQMGAPMPPLRYALFHDSASKKSDVVKAGHNDTNIVKTQTSAYITGETIVHNDTVVTKHHKRKRKKHSEDDDTESGNAGSANQMLTNKDLDNGANLFVVMFNPTCSHCQAETQLFEKNKELFQKSKIALLANPQMGQYLHDFLTYTHADQYSSFIYLGIDSSGFTKQVFLYQSLPQINIYNKDRKLIKVYTGEVAIDSLKKYIQ